MEMLIEMGVLYWFVLCFLLAVTLYDSYFNYAEIQSSCLSFNNLFLCNAKRSKQFLLKFCIDGNYVVTDVSLIISEKAI